MKKVAICPVCGYEQPVEESDLGKEVICDMCGVAFVVEEILDVEQAN